MPDWFQDNGFLSTDGPGPAATPVFDAGLARQNLVNEYNTTLGRQGAIREDEIAQYLPAIQQFGWEAVQSQIRNSPEALGRQQQQAANPAPGTPQAYLQPALSLPQMAKPQAYTLPTAAEAEQTPGYGFTRDQGIQGMTRNAIAAGKGLNGGSLREIGQYATGLADQFYGNRVSQGMAANNLNFGQGLQTNQFNSGQALNQFGANLGANQQFWGQGFNENRNAFDQYRGLQNDAFDQWYKLAELGNPGNPYT